MIKQILLLLLSIFLFSACQGVPTLKPAPTNLPRLNTVQPLPGAVQTAVATPTPAAAETAQPTATTAFDAAVQVAQAYMNALQAGNYPGAAELLSSYSLMVEEVTRTEAAEKLKARMASEKWSNVQVLETSPYSEKTTLVRVAYRMERKDPNSGETVQSDVEALWPLRLENGQWRVNADQLIDYHTLNIPEQTTNGLTIKPRRLALYTDRVSLTLLVQNRTNEPIVLGQPNEVMAVFLYNGEKIEAEKTRFIFDRLRSYPDITIELKQPVSTYPDGIIIRQWKNYKVDPWFTFQFSQ